MHDDELPAGDELVSPPVDAWDRVYGGYDTIVVGTGIVSIVMAAVYWAMRIGFENSLLVVARPVGLALFLSSFPLIASRGVWAGGAKQLGAVPPWWVSYSFLWLLGLSLTAILGRLVPSLRFSPLPLLAVAGVVSFVAIFISWIRKAPLWRSAVVLIGSGAFSVWASGVVWGTIYKNPLFYENYIVNGKIHHDGLAYAAMGNMLRTYHVATIGVDGLNYVPYHWGTPWLFAQLSNLTGAQVFDFYQLGFAVMMVPLFFGGIVTFAVAMRNRRKSRDAGQDLRRDFRFWLVFLAGCIGIIPESGLYGMGVWTAGLISESYTVAVPCGLLFLATVVAFYDGVSQRAGAATGRARAVTDSLFVLIGIPLGIVMLGYLKISLMVFGLALAMYALFRLRLYRRPLYLIAAALLVVLFYITYLQVSLPAHREGISPFDFLWAVVRPAWWPFFPIVHLFWSWVYIAVRLRSEGVGTFADLKEAADERRLLDVEAVALVALLGIVPGLLVHIDGGSAFYFSDVQRWLSVALIMSRLPMFLAAILGETPPERKRKRSGFLSRLDGVTVRQVVTVFLLLPVVGSMVANGLAWPITMARANGETRRAVYQATITGTIPSGLHALLRLRDRATLAEGLRRSPNFVVGQALRGLSEMPVSVRRHTALFIPQDQVVFWHSLTRPGACAFQPLLATALSSIAMVDGMPAIGCRLSRYYGMGSFTPRTRPQTPADAEPAALCRRAVAAGMSQVMVLTFDTTRHANVTMVQCRPPR
jgi:hypothetical protein